jgi:hypothetical protein
MLEPNWRFNMNKFLVIAMLTLGQLWLTADVQGDTLYDAREDFVPGSPVSGVNGVWSYGYMGGSLGFTLFEQYNANPIGFGWRRNPNTADTPSFYKFTGSSGLPGVDIGDIVLHPGPNLDDEFAVLRFTVPTTGLYDLDVIWEAGNGGVVDIKIFRNALELYSDLADLNGGSYSSLGLSLTANETIDIRVGRYDSFNSDSTPINMRLTAVPEPSAFWAVACFAAGCFTRRRPISL